MQSVSHKSSLLVNAKESLGRKREEQGELSTHIRQDNKKYPNYASDDSAPYLEGERTSVMV